MRRQDLASLLKKRRELLLLGVAVFIILLIEAAEFNRTYAFYRLAGLKQQTLSLPDGAPYSFNVQQGRFVAENNDPHVTFANINARVSSISLRCRNSISGLGQIFYSSGGEPFSEARSVTYPTETNLYSRTLDFPEIERVSALRFDLTNMPDDKVVCRDIVINPRPAFQFSVFRTALYIAMLFICSAVLLAEGVRKQTQSLFASRRFQSFAVPFLAILLVFPDVIFLGASLRITDQFNGSWKALPPEAWYPQSAHRMWFDHYFDAGGALYQSEPMMEFMLRSFRNRESPYWNPYSAAGSLGPETLIDNKFSAFTLAYVILGGGSLVYNLLMLIFQFWAAYFIYRVARERLALSFLASTTATILYLLNGYAVANLGSNVAQSYLYMPLCLFASMALMEKPTAARICGTVLSFAALFSTTFIPTTFSELAGIYGVLIGYAFMLSRKTPRPALAVLRLMAAHAICLLASVLLLAFIYFPIAENLRTVGTVGTYAERTPAPLSWIMIPSVFSPSHFFESYRAMDSGVQNYVTRASKSWVVIHFGTTALSLAICAISLKRKDFWPLVGSSLIAIAIGLGPIFGIPGLSTAIGQIPLISGFSTQYWWPLVVTPVIILAAVGVDNLQHRYALPALTFVLLAILVGSLIAVGRAYGIQPPNEDYKKWSVALTVIVATAGCLTMLLSSFVSDPVSRNRMIAGLVVLLFVELTVDSKVIRIVRNDMFGTPPDEIRFLKEKVGLYRTLTITPLSQNVGLRPELGSAFGIQEVTSINQGDFPSYISYFRQAISLDKSEQLFYNYYPSLREIVDKPEINKIDWRAIDLLGVKYVIIPKVFTNYRQALIDRGLLLVFETPDAYVFQNPNVLPRAFTIAWDPAWDRGQQNNSIVLPSDLASRVQPAQIGLYHNTEVHLDGNVNEDSLLVLSDNWHADWTAYVNGVKTPILLVNGTFRGVQIPPGPYEVQMFYQPRTLKLAFGVSGAVIVLLICLLLGQRRTNQLLAGVFSRNTVEV